MEEENKKVEGPVMSEEEFKSIVARIAAAKKAGIMFQASQRFKSVRRAIKRGLCSPLGEIYPKRPFNNRKPTPGRLMNETKKSIYGRLKSK